MSENSPEPSAKTTPLSVSGLKKIVWAVDPFSENEDFQRATAWILRQLSVATHAPVIPTYLHGGYPMELSMREGMPSSSEVQKRAQDSLSATLRRVEIPTLQPVQVVADAYGTLRQGADLLTTFARQQGADLIVASTHGRKGIARAILGSFAETLIHRSEVPLLIVNPEHEEPSDLGKILFSTDFSPESRLAFDQLIGFAKSLNSRVRLFHKIGYLLSPGLEPTFGYPLPAGVIKAELESCQAEARLWVDSAAKQGVTVEVAIDSTTVGSAAAAVLAESAREKASIAMAAQSGPASSILLGSTTRKVLREAPHPVWVFYHKHS
jgi:nucleotide-binding universal stress UspA family protein